MITNACSAVRSARDNSVLRAQMRCMRCRQWLSRRDVMLRWLGYLRPIGALRVVSCSISRLARRMQQADEHNAQCVGPLHYMHWGPRSYNRIHYVRGNVIMRDTTGLSLRSILRSHLQLTRRSTGVHPQPPFYSAPTNKALRLPHTPSSLSLTLQLDLSIPARLTTYRPAEDILSAQLGTALSQLWWDEASHTEPLLLGRLAHRPSQSDIEGDSVSSWFRIVVGCCGAGGRVACYEEGCAEEAQVQVAAWMSAHDLPAEAESEASVYGAGIHDDTPQGKESGVSER